MRVAKDTHQEQSRTKEPRKSEHLWNQNAIEIHEHVRDLCPKSLLSKLVNVPEFLKRAWFTQSDVLIMERRRRTGTG